MPPDGVMVDAASEAKSELVLDHLRTALGVLPVVPLDCHGDAADIMTRWLKSRVPAGFDVEDDIELQNTREARNIVRCRYQDIDSKEVLTHIDAGKRVIKLGVVWRDAIRPGFRGYGRATRPAARRVAGGLWWRRANLSRCVASHF